MTHTFVVFTQRIILRGALFLLYKSKGVVEIFKTNIICKVEAIRIISELQTLFPSLKFIFDLEDSDNILCAKGEYPNA